jgi:hypothetical protein
MVKGDFGSSVQNQSFGAARNLENKPLGKLNKTAIQNIPAYPFHQSFSEFGRQRCRSGGYFYLLG